MRIERVKVEDIHYLTSKVRLYIDEEYLDRLVKDISRRGVLNPPVLIKIKDKYSIVDGYHRIEAVRRLGIQEIEAYVYDEGEIDPFIEGLRCNIFQKTLDPISIAYAIRELLNRRLSWKEIEEITGFSEKQCRRYLKLLDLSEEIKEKIGKGELPPFGEEVKRMLEGQNVRYKTKKTSSGVRCLICGKYPEKGKNEGSWMWLCSEHAYLHSIIVDRLKHEWLSKQITSPPSSPYSISPLTAFLNSSISPSSLPATSNTIAPNGSIHWLN